VSWFLGTPLRVQGSPRIIAQGQGAGSPRILP
jgi:hypothetical protein